MKTKKSKYNFIQVYNIWANGRSYDDLDQQYPVDSNCERIWHDDFEKASQEYLNVIVKNKTVEGDFNDEIFQDCQVNLYSIDIDVKKFKNMFNLNFDLKNQKVQEMIPYYNDYDFSNVAEKIIKFT